MTPMNSFISVFLFSGLLKEGTEFDETFIYPKNKMIEENIDWIK